jgi:hypothetical protein
MARRPLVVSDGDDAADGFRQSLDEQERAGERDQGLEMIDRDVEGAGRTHLAHGPGTFGEGIARIDEKEGGREKEDDEEDQVDRSLGPG